MHLFRKTKTLQDLIQEKNKSIQSKMDNGGSNQATEVILSDLSK